MSEARQPEAREYVLGTDREELERLGLQHRCWRAQAYEHWERAGLTSGQRVLDVGAGPGFATLDLARLVGPRGRVTAVDVSRRFLDHVAREAEREGLEQVATVEADVQALALEPATADAAWTRWVLSFVRDPAAVIAGVARALVPGGVWAIQEYVAYSTMRVGPGPSVLARVLPAIEASWRAQGGEPDVGLRLPALLEAAGFLVTETRPIARIARPDGSLWEWPTSFYENFVPRLVTGGFLAKEDGDAFLAEWRRRREEPDTLFVAPMVVAITAVKG